MTPNRRRPPCRIAAAALGLLLLAPLAAFAEKADQDKPLLIEANRMSADDARKIATFEGAVVLTKGTIEMTAERIVVTEPAEGARKATATGNPVRFHQRLDSKDGKPGALIEGEALRMEYDEQTERIELFDKARVTRDGDEVIGDYILYDQRTEYFSVRGGKGPSSGRVRAIIQPKSAPDRPTGPAPAKPAPGSSVR